MPSRRLRVGGTGTTVTPSLVASRSSGAAPLAVHFDATSTTSSAVGDAFRQVTYTFGYGDSGSGNWSTDSTSKNSDSGGPIGAHVYETAGTYTVTVTADDGTSSASTTVTVTVSNPDTVYSGTNTICITNASTGTNDWGPSGCAYQATLPSGGAAWTGKRVLFKRGVDYTALGAITVPRTSSNVRIGAAGTGTKPLIRRININEDSRPTTAQWSEDVVVSDIDFRAVDGNLDPAIKHNQCGRNVLILRCDIADSSATATSVNNSIILGADLGFYSQTMGSLEGGGWNGGGDQNRVLARSAFYVPKYIFVVECYQRGASIRPTVSYNALEGSFASTALMGNDFRICGEHMHRLYLARKTLIQHSKLEDIGKDTIRHAIKMMSGGTRVPQENVEDRPDGLTWYTEQVVIRNNILGASDSPHDWTVQIGPQNGNEPEGVVDTILENNTFINSATKSVDIVAGPARRITTRGNVLSGGTIRINQSGATYPEPIQSGWRGPYYGQFTG